jgi:hypothetical protein
MMRRVIHRDFMRGPVARRAAILLPAGLLFVLVASLFHGLRLLRA